MKGRTMKSFTYAAGLLLLTPLAALADPQEAHIEVSGLYCPSCSYIAGESLAKAESVEVIEYIPGETDSTATYVVTYDDSVTTLAEIYFVCVSKGARVCREGKCAAR